MKEFADFTTEEQPLDGDKERIDNILNRPILVTGFRIKKKSV